MEDFDLTDSPGSRRETRVTIEAWAVVFVAFLLGMTAGVLLDEQTPRPACVETTR